MNLLLFEPAETIAPLPRHDPRAVHLLDVLHRRAGDTFDAGLINGPRGKGTLVVADGEALILAFTWGPPPPPAAPIILIVGLPRPQTARDVLRDATTLGVATLHFVTTEKGDPNYGQSSLWRTNEWRRHVLAGAEQAFDTRVPQVVHGHSLADTIATLPTTGARCALDNYEAPRALSVTPLETSPITLALGAERGWSGAERVLLREQGFVFAHLGERVLRTETACIAALTLVKARLGLM